MKIRRIIDFQHEFSFLSSSENLDAYYSRFLESDLGKIYSAIPWDGLVKGFGLNESKKVIIIKSDFNKKKSNFKF